MTNACDVSSPLFTGDPYFTNYTVTSAVTQLVAPPGTAQVRYRMALLEGGFCFQPCPTFVGDLDFDDPGMVQTITNQPILIGMYPTGTHPFEYTNALSFTVVTAGATFPTNSINVILDGINVTSNLVITGSPSNETVVYPNLLVNAPHTAIISATNSLGNGLLITNNFDTFASSYTQANYLWEASDFDYDGGDYINSTNWVPNAYQYEISVTNIDFQHTPMASDQYPYRANGIPQQYGRDYLTFAFVSPGGNEYDLADFGPGDWANYTRDYPAGTYYVYVRTAGVGTNLMDLALVTSGEGTTNQTVRVLGQWNSIGINSTTYSWVPLTDGVSAAPVSVTLSGVETLRLTSLTGSANPNYFMLVPATGIKVTATRQGTNASISFPTQLGVVYRIFSRNALSGGTWNLMTNVLGAGAVQSLSVPAGSAEQFYVVTAP